MLQANFKLNQVESLSVHDYSFLLEIDCSFTRYGSTEIFAYDAKLPARYGLAILYYLLVYNSIGIRKSHWEWQ